MVSHGRQANESIADFHTFVAILSASLRARGVDENDESADKAFKKVASENLKK